MIRWDLMTLEECDLGSPAATWRAPIDELIPVGPLQVKVRLPQGLRAGAVRFLVSGGSVPISVNQGWAAFEVKSILDHEVAVVG